MQVYVKLLHLDTLHVHVPLSLVRFPETLNTTSTNSETVKICFQLKHYPLLSHQLIYHQSFAVTNFLFKITPTVKEESKMTMFSQFS